jgi:hypothetical protein
MAIYQCYKPWTGTDGSLTTAGAGVEGADLKTSEWFDTSAWEEKSIAWEVDSGGTVDFNLNAHISSQGAYELNNKTCTTEDYVNIIVVNAHTSKVYTRVDVSDLEELSTYNSPIRSMRLIIDNDQAEAVTGCQVWIEGWTNP